jgi:hypothetical protein
MQDPEHGLAARRTADTSGAAKQDRPGRSCRTVQYPAQSPRQAPQQSLEQPPRDSPAERPLQLMTARPQHCQAGTGRARRGVVQQRGLTEPGRCLHQDHRTRPTLGSTQHLGDDPSLGITLQQRMPLRRAVPRPGRHHVSVAPIRDRAKTARSRWRSCARILTDLREITESWR